MCTNNRGLRVVFDIDDTISEVQVKGDYANAKEIEEITDKIRGMKAAGHTIILHTARGMVSCGGDVEKARGKNEKVLEAWLSEHDVPYDEIWWGKPYADVYVDDKGVSAEDLARLGVDEMQGFSGAKVTRIGRMVVKQAENVSEQAKWYKESEALGFPYKTPKIHSCNLGKMYMEYVPGSKMSEALSWVAEKAVQEIAWNVLSYYRDEELEGENDVEWYEDYVGGRAEEIGVSRERVVADIRKTADLLKRRTFCHGDLSASNVILGDDHEIYLIDPSPKKVSSWLLDASKLRASLRGLDDILKGYAPLRREKALEKMYDLLTEPMPEEEREAIELLERGHWIRVARYAKVLGREDVFEGLMRQIREWYG